MTGVWPKNQPDYTVNINVEKLFIGAPKNNAEPAGSTTNLISLP